MLHIKLGDSHMLSQDFASQATWPARGAHFYLVSHSICASAFIGLCLLDTSEYYLEATSKAAPIIKFDWQNQCYILSFLVVYTTTFLSPLDLKLHS